MKGYVLIELLVAGTLLSLAGTGLTAGLLQGIKAERTAREIRQTYDPLRLCWKKMEKDLRNSIYVRQQNFTGKQDEMIFPVLQNVPEKSSIQRVGYFLQDGNLFRREQELSNRLAKKDPQERIVLKEVEQVRLEYAYLDAEERLIFKPFWLEEPYFGIPKAVQIEVKRRGKVFSKLIGIPQGKWGRLNEKIQISNDR